MSVQDRAAAKPPLLAVAAGLASILLSASLGAQGPRGVGPDARTPAAGSLRVSFGIGWDRTGERYEHGTLRDLGSRFTFDTLGVGLFPFLGVTETGARIAAAMPDFRASLGASVARDRAAVETTPLSVEYGLTSRLAVSALVPFVTSGQRVDFVLNPGRTTSTVGLNPSIANPAIAAGYGALLSQLDAASAFVSGRISSCPATPTAPGCAAILTNVGTARALVSGARAYADAVAALYGGRGASIGAPFIPLAGGPAQLAIAARLAGLKGQFAALGAPGVSAAAPIGAPAPLTADGFQAMLGDSAFGIRSRGVVPVVRRGMGNASVTATYRFHDSYPVAGEPRRAWWRGAAVASYALGARSLESSELIAAPLGDAAPSIRLGFVGEAGRGSRYSLATSVAYATSSGVSLQVRAPRSAADEFPEASRVTTVAFTPGAEIRLDIAPRWAPTDAIGLAATYTYRHRAADAWAIASTLPSPPPDGRADAVGGGAAATEHRFGASIGYSTLAAWRRGRARWPIEVVLVHFQTTRGTGGVVPKVSHDDFIVRWYWRAR